VFRGNSEKEGESEERGHSRERRGELAVDAVDGLAGVTEGRRLGLKALIPAGQENSKSRDALGERV